MAYREEVEALRARVEQLEADLDSAHATIRKLEGGGARPRERSDDSSLGARLAGGSMSIRYERTFDGEISDTVMEDVLEQLRARFGVLGAISAVGRSFSWTSYGSSSRWIEVSISRRAGKTEVRVVERLFPLAGGLFGGVGGGVGGGGMGLVVPFGLALGLGPWTVLLALWWVLAVLYATRIFFARAAGRRRREVSQATEEISRTIDASLRRRVARGAFAAEADTEEREAEREAEAAEEASARTGRRR